MLNYSQLNDRDLWFDGQFVINADNIDQFINVNGVCVDQITPDIEQYNKLCTQHNKILTKNELLPITPCWNIPPEYSNMDVVNYVSLKHDQIASMCNWSKDEHRYRNDRISYELSQYASNDMVDVVRTLIYIIDTLEAHNRVWGPGRGSSVSSYVLFVIGVHDVDSVFYQLDFTDFIKIRSNHESES